MAEEELVHALTTRAAKNKRSMKAEIRAIHEAAALSEGPVLLGTALSEASRKMGLTNADVEALKLSIGANRKAVA